MTPVDKAAFTDEALEIIRVLVAVTKGKICNEIYLFCFKMCSFYISLKLLCVLNENQPHIFPISGRFDLLPEETKNGLQTFMFKVLYHSGLPLDLRSNAGIIYIGSVMDKQKIFALLETGKLFNKTMTLLPHFENLTDKTSFKSKEIYHYPLHFEMYLNNFTFLIQTAQKATFQRILGPNFALPTEFSHVSP